MEHRVLGACPVCSGRMRIKVLHCPACNTEVRGNFTAGKFAHLTESQLEFVEVFIKSRGNIKEVERELGISYPTVRNKLDEIIKALGYSVDTSPDDSIGERRKEILTMLEKGEINSQEAIKMLKNL
ncbi:MAG: DUF2089 domain-containing protein [Halanaerobiaceae bacterium]|nr:DUF2089 domain-containing protein [Halanaerobiaceae bacterium]